MTSPTSEQQALYFRQTLEEIVVVARRGLADNSPSLCLALIEGKAQAALGSTKVVAPEAEGPDDYLDRGDAG